MNYYLKSKKNMFVPVGILLFLIIFFSLSKEILLDISLKIQQYATILSSVIITNTNNFRILNSKNNLEVSDLLTAAAQMKADDMASKGYFSHVGLNGESPWFWFKKVGYNYYYAGENLAVDYTESSDITDGWINSAKHKANLLNKNFTEVGIGISEGFFENHKTTFVVQFFGKPKKGKTNQEKLSSNAENNRSLYSIEATSPIITTDNISEGEVLGI